MPVKKPRNLIVRHETKAEKLVREKRESALSSSRNLPAEAPSRLNEHPIAAAAWRRLMREYASIEGEIVTRLDMDILIDYCILIEQISELDLMRKVAYTLWLDFSKKHKDLKNQGEIDEAIAMAVNVVGAFDAIVKLDARADQKRKSLLQLRQSLYLTPRSRAGVAPKGKEEETPPDDLEQLLDEVTDFVNGSDAE